MTKGTFEYRGVSVAYEEEGIGQPVLIIHGWSMCREMMKPCTEPAFEGIQGNYRRIYMDLPGMGESTLADWVESADDLAEIIRAFLTFLSPGRKALLVGESYGGYLSWGIGTAHPDEIGGMVLLCPVITAGDKRQLPPSLDVREKDEALLAGLTEEEKASFTYFSVLQTAECWEMTKKEILPGFEAADFGFLDRRLKDRFREEPSDKEPFPHPALIFMGKQDIAVGYKDQFDLAARFPKGSSLMLDRAGHNLQIEQRELYISVLKGWLNSNRKEWL